MVSRVALLRVAEHHGRTDYASKRAHSQPPNRQGTHHRRLQPFYPEKHKVSCSGFLHKANRMQQSCSYYKTHQHVSLLPSVATSPSLPSVTILRHHPSSSPFVITLRHHPSSSLPSIITLHHHTSLPSITNPSSDILLCDVLSPLHHPSSDVLLCDLLLCDVLSLLHHPSSDGLLCDVLLRDVLSPFHHPSSDVLLCALEPLEKIVRNSED